jgi:cellulose synthase/poly-beta-1,6-N-acetylglucosamine synthase-like glycosyltransferase
MKSGVKNMGTTILIVFVLVLALCFCIYNSWEKREKSKRMFKHEKKNISVFNTYIAWAIYSIIIFLSLATIMGYGIYVLMDNISKMRN